MRQASYLHPLVLMESDPSIACPLKVSPVRKAEVSPHRMPVSWVLKRRIISISPSPSTSFNADRLGTVSVPVAPKVPVVRTATGMTPLLLGLMLFGKLPGYDVNINCKHNQAKFSHEDIK